MLPQQHYECVRLERELRLRQVRLKPQPPPRPPRRRLGRGRRARHPEAVAPRTPVRPAARLTPHEYLELEFIVGCDRR